MRGGGGGAWISLKQKRGAMWRKDALDGTWLSFTGRQIPMTYHLGENISDLPLGAKAFRVVFEAGQKFATDLESSTPLLATSLLAMPPQLTRIHTLTGITQHEPSPELPLSKTFSLARTDWPFVCLHGHNMYW